MTIEQAKSEIMQIYGALSPNKQRAIDTLMKIEPCEDAISRQEVLGIVRDMKGLARAYVLPEVINQIKSLPPVNPQEPTDTWSIKDVADNLAKHGLIVEQEPKTGHWKRISMDKYVQHAMAYYKCSECGKDIIGEHNYCPNCGTKMESEEKIIV